MNKKKVLIIEDNLWVQEILYTMLSKDYHLIIRSDGAEGIKAFEALGETLYAVITDAEMPMMNGDAVIDWVQSKNGAMQILLMVTGSERFDLEHLLRRPNVQLLKKPFHKSEVLSKLARISALQPKAA
ncbi:MAG: response regulator [Chloroherpetonaceae bacterium]